MDDRASPVTPAAARLAMLFANTAPADAFGFRDVRSRAGLNDVPGDGDAIIVAYPTAPGATLPAVITTYGFDLADKALAAGSLFFKTNPVAADLLEGMRDRPLSVLEPLSFKLVADALATHGLSFVGPARLADAVTKLNFSPEAAALLQAEHNIIVRETKKDLMLDRGFRIDIFARAPRRLDPQTAAQTIAAMTFRTMRSEIDKLTLLTAYAEIKPTDHARRVFTALTQGPASSVQLAERNADCPDVWRNMEAMLALAAMDAVEPV